MDRNQQENGQRMLMNPASLRCTECRRHPVHNGGRQMEETAGHRSTMEHVSNVLNRRPRPSSVERGGRGYGKNNNNVFRGSDVHRDHGSSELRRIVRKPESGSGDSSAAPCRRSSSSRTRHAVPGRTLLVRGLGREVNCDNVFNIFCLYGNVTTVKILRNGLVLVELNDVEAAKRCVNHLHLLPLDQKNKLKIK
jgi:hypothetical protein